MSIESISVNEIMIKEVKTETEDQNIKAACKIMRDNNIGSVVIVKSKNQSDNNNNYGKPIGIITERDVILAIGTLNPAQLEMPIREIMSKPVITVSAKNSIKDALQVMQHKNIRRLVIAEKETMMGIITDKDIFRVIMNNQALIPSLLQDNALMANKSSIHEQFGEYWLSNVFHKS